MEIRRRPPNPSVKVANLEYAIPHDDCNPNNILEKIIWAKYKEIEVEKNRESIQSLKTKIANLPETKSFLNSIINPKLKPALIAEIKKASPSKGIIREDFNPEEIAKIYENSGASCISVLTERNFFKGGFDILNKVRKIVDIPILCKDFIFTPYQIYQARVAGADAVLLIASVLTDQDLIYLGKISQSLGLSTLVEVHNSNEFSRVLNLKVFPLIGINNRDLKTFKTDISNTETLCTEFKNEILKGDISLISESGIHTKDHVNRVSQVGVRGILVRESIISKKNIERAIKNIYI